MPQGYIIPFSSTELACAVRQPGPCVRAVCECVALPCCSPGTWPACDHVATQRRAKTLLTLHSSVLTSCTSQATLHLISSCTSVTSATFYTQQTCTRRSFYTEAASFSTQKLFYREVFTQEGFYTQQFFHTEAFAHTNWGGKKTPYKFAIRFFTLSFFFFLIVLQALGIPSYLGRREEVNANGTAIKKLLPQFPWSVGDGVWSWFSGWFCYRFCYRFVIVLCRVHSPNPCPWDTRLLDLFMQC